MSLFARILSLIRANGSTTEGEEQKANKIIKSFYPPLPDSIAEEPVTAAITLVENPDIIIEEIERKFYRAKPWKVLGRNGLPSIIWRQLWPIVKGEILDLFKASLDEGTLPS